MLQLSETTLNTVNSFLIFESCEERMILMNNTFRALRDMFGRDFSLSSICMLTSCSNTQSNKINKRQSELIDICLSNGMDFMIWDKAEDLQEDEWLQQESELKAKIAKIKQFSIMEQIENEFDVSML